MENKNAKWVCTDIDSCQWRRKTDDPNFFCVEMWQVNDYTAIEGHAACAKAAHAFIYLRDYSEEEIAEVCKEYAYSSLENMQAEFGREEANLLLAECFFEREAVMYEDVDAFPSFAEAAEHVLMRVLADSLQAYKDAHGIEGIQQTEDGQELSVNHLSGLRRCFEENRNSKSGEEKSDAANIIQILDMLDSIEY